MPPEKKQQQKSTNPLQTLFSDLDNILTSAVTQEELMDAINAVFRALQELNTKLSGNIAENKSILDNANDTLRQRITALGEELRATIANTRTNSTADLQNAIAQLREEVNEVSDQIPDLPDYTGDFDGLSDRITRLDTLVIGENLRNALEALPDGEKLAIEAVEGLRKELDELKKVRSQVAQGGVSDMRIRQAFKYILKTEEPTGAIDGANTEYTVSQPIFAVLAFSLNGETIAQLPNYTVSGNKVTFTTALPAAYSGKDFELKYI